VRAHWNATAIDLSKDLLADDHKLGTKIENLRKQYCGRLNLLSMLHPLEVEGPARQSNVGVVVALDKKQPMKTWSVCIVCKAHTL
jgi:hypothetical protein